MVDIIVVAALIVIIACVLGAITLLGVIVLELFMDAQ